MPLEDDQVICQEACELLALYHRIKPLHHDLDISVETDVIGMIVYRNLQRRK